MNLFQNLDLLSVGVAVASTAVLGFSIYFNNRRSITNRTFLWFALVTALWGTANFFGYKITEPPVALWVLRFSLGLAIFQAFFVFKLLYVFPSDKFNFPKLYRICLVPLVLFAALLATTPMTLYQIKEVSALGRITKIINGPAMPLFGFFSVSMVVFSLYVFLKNIFRTESIRRTPHLFILVGASIMFFLIITFNFIFPALLDNSAYIPLGALSTFPFVAFTSYAILKHKLFNIRVAGTAVLVFLLAVVTFLEVILARDLYLILYRSSIFILVLLFGILLIRGVLREVEQRERLQELTVELRAANEKLKALDRAKTEFVSLGSHQLRSPLTAIKGYTSMLLEGSFGELSEKARQAINTIFQSSQKLVRVIEDFLNITRIELGTMKYEMQPFNLKEVTETVINELKPTIQQKGLKISFVAEPRQNYTITGDSGKISQIVNNLIDNAVKYTPASSAGEQQGSIVVELKRLDGKVRLVVSDTGIGIAPDVLPKLFEKFIRANGAGEVNITGAGLGLYVAKQIVEAHNGKIWAESEGVGKGSRFVVELD